MPRGGIGAVGPGGDFFGQQNRVTKKQRQAEAEAEALGARPPPHPVDGRGECSIALLLVYKFQGTKYQAFTKKVSLLTVPVFPACACAGVRA